MPLPTGTTSLTRAEDRLIFSISSSPVFQTLVGALDQAEAADRVFVDEVTRPTDSDAFDEDTWKAFYPLALIHPPDDQAEVTFRHTASGLTWEHLANVRLAVRFERLLPTDLDEPSARREFKDIVIGIMEEVAFLSELDGCFSVGEASPVGAPAISLEEKPFPVVQFWTWLVTNEVNA